MAAAGIGWGIYSLRGRGVANPLRSTARNFLLTVPLALLVSLALAGDFHADSRGLALAVISGAVASGLGLATPTPKGIRYLKARPADAEAAASRIASGQVSILDAVAPAFVEAAAQQPAPVAASRASEAKSEARGDMGAPGARWTGGSA